jgi:glycosyltransferase involved in cell wall biosynthesis
MVVDVVIPALNEQESIGRVVTALTDPRIRRVIVADNGSADATAQVARQAGAIVVSEPRRGYGSACLRALKEVALNPPDAVLFVDGDFSDDPSEAGLLLDALQAGHDLVIGSRVRHAQPGALTPHARFGNWLATGLVRRIWGARFTDLGPFRAVRWSALQRLKMNDPDFGWTIEMQVKAAQVGLRCTEVDVSYRPRIGRSKVSGTIVGSVRAGEKILRTIALQALSASGRRAPAQRAGAER